MKKLDKPVGVYVLTILILIRIGFFQFLNYWFDIKNAEGDVPFTMVFVSLFLCAFTVGAAIWAFTGDDSGRIAVLIFVSLNVLWWLFLCISTIAYSDPKQIGWIGLIPGIMQHVLLLIFTWWYFTKENVVAYYKQNSE